MSVWHPVSRVEKATPASTLLGAIDVTAKLVTTLMALEEHALISMNAGDTQVACVLTSVKTPLDLITAVARWVSNFHLMGGHVKT